jgi:hypothetical protein
MHGTEDRFIKDIEDLAVRPDNLSIFSWRDTGSFQHTDGILDVIEHMSSLPGIIPREPRLEIIDDPRYLDIIEGYELLCKRETILIAVQYLSTEAMECPDIHTIRILSDDGRETFSHILGCLIGKGQTEDVRWMGIRLTEYVRDSHREELRLPTPRSGDYEDRSIDRIDRLLLFRIELLVSFRVGNHIVKKLQ